MNRFFSSLFIGLFCYVVHSSPCFAKFKLELSDSGLSPAQKAATLQLLAEAETALPPLLKQRLNTTINVTWNANLAKNVYGRTNGNNSLVLNRALLASLTDGSAATEKTSRTHGSIRRELLATVLHEISHLYDDQGFFSKEQASKIYYCKRLAKSKDINTLPTACIDYAKRHFTISDDARFLDLAGWPLTISEEGLRDRDNSRVDRSPDPYELTNAKEFMAVNLEYFLLDPNYRCRRPKLAQWFTEHFNWQPATMSTTTCPKEYVYLYANDDPRETPLETLDPERVYEVDYLFAAANKEWMSRWGHSMLRLVICAPDRPKGPDCRLDLEYHRVLSYRAFINDLQISSLKGLTGSYPSRLFILPLNQVVDEYTKLEWRPLESIPLKLTPEEISSLVALAVELHWSYDGNYYFISNNCAVETLKLLRTALQHSDLKSLNTITPSGLLRLLEARGLANTAVLKDSANAMKYGYLFDSYKERYEAMFKVIKTPLALPDNSVEEWLNRSAANRASFYKQADLRTSAALLLLEQAALRRQTLLAYQVLKDKYMNSNQSPTDTKSLDQTKKNLADLIKHSTFLSRPASLLTEGYGLPQAEEIAKLTELTQQEQVQLEKITSSLKDQLKQLLPMHINTELEGTDQNIKTLGNQLRALHKASGGIELAPLD